jgi:hypothetical protein
MARRETIMSNLLILSLTLAPLTARGDDLAGHYVLRGVMEVGSELLLKPDGTFEYMLAYGAADYWAKGTWRHEGDAVILNSAGKEEAAFRLLRSEAGKPGRIRVWVMGKNGHGVANIRVGLKVGDQHLEATTDSDGAAVFPDAKGARAVSFEVRVYSVQAGPFDGSASDRDFYFEINGDAITQVLFKNERLAIEDKGLVMKHWNEDKPMHHEKE